ncbi:MAG: hypothetical protein HY905_04270 [Deltaproteobacteria bacterium]|nr:hypothetical protein [Deltaproteobacteria bacterium]
MSRTIALFPRPLPFRRPRVRSPSGRPLAPLRPRVRSPLPLLLALAISACGRGTILVGEPVDAASDDSSGSDGAEPDEAGADVGDHFDEALDADDDGAGEGESADEGLEDAAEDASVDAGPVCPIWAVPSGADPDADGTEAHPFIGLPATLAARGPCEHVILRGGTADDPFDAAVDIGLGDSESLLIEGDPSDAALAELEAYGDPGLFVTSAGTLTLRHLAVRDGLAPTGGCLNAQVGALRLEDTEWTDCRAVEEGSAVWVYSPDVEILDSRFLRNEAQQERTEPPPAVGAACLDGPLDVTHILVQRSSFEDNSADWGHALYLKTSTRDAVVRDCLFLRNASRRGPAALGGQVGELSHNRFEGNQADVDAAVVEIPGTPDTRIFHNLFIENRSGRESVALQPCHGLVANNLFVRNVCRNAPGEAGCSAAIWVTAGCSIDLLNNTFVDNASEGGIAHLSYDSAFGSVHANVFVGGDGRAAVGTDYTDWGVSTEMAYNVWWTVPDPVFGDGVRLADGNVEADPAFTGIDDFHLGPGSAAIDAGDPDPSLADPDGSRNDPGAFGGPAGDWTPLPEGGAP